MRLIDLLAKPDSIPNGPYQRRCRILEPRPYQVEGIRWLKTTRRGMLVDEPGLGKTIEAAEAAELPVVVAAPTYLCEQWFDVLRANYAEDTIVPAFEGAFLKRHELLQIPAHWYIVNIEMMRSHTMPNVNTLIVDESHHLRGRNSLQSQGAFECASRTPYVYLLTGTPIKREADDLYSQLRLIAPLVFTSYHAFVDNWCKVVNTPWARQVYGVKNPRAFAKMISKWMFGRTSQDVALQVPSKIFQEISVPRSAVFDKLYRKAKEMYDYQEVSEEHAVANLRAVTATYKAKQDVVENLLEDNGPAVIFCWYKDTAKLLGRRLDLPVITGEMKAPDRAHTAKEGGSVVVTISSLSEGVDLAHLQNVVFYEEDYTPGGEIQALSRVCRSTSQFGFNRIYYVMVSNTIDTICRATVKRRGGSAKQILKEALSQ